MFLRAKFLQLEADKPIVILNREDAEEMGVKPLERVELDFKDKKIIAIVNIAGRIVREGDIGLYEEIQESLDVKPNEKIRVETTNPPKSLDFIKKKLVGQTLKPKEIYTIVKDTVNRRLSHIELTAFVTSLYNKGMTMGETASLSKAMARTGQTLKLRTKAIYDKHSIGGCPGDKTSILVVPVVAAAGLTIPKTSSRAITSPAGSADRFECIAPVDLTLEEVRRVVNKTNGCLVWGGSVDLAPADDIFIQIEYLLSIDPFLLPSVMSKKKAVNAKYVVIDMPTGRETKVSTNEEFENLANQFIQLGKKLGIKVNCVSTFAEQPIGYSVGPILEAREALDTLVKGRGSEDLIDKVTTLAGVLLEFGGAKNGKKAAIELLNSGKAYKKLKEIIEAQGGNPDVKPEDLCPGEKIAEFKSKKSGKVLWISNKCIDMVAREAGAPRDKGAGVYFRKKLGDKVRRGETLFEIYSEKSSKFKRAIELVHKIDIMGIGKERGMMLEKLPAVEEEKRYFILER
ncbi:MAG: AMP phosphorylase [Candidatus Aenigmarchaeota archaeon]|nr:AMP phosphorylase [Candidatus Aenigmarchaeota archaeon]